jgi:putative redox protein
MLKVTTNFLERMVFEASNGRVSAKMDASSKFGGEDKGMTPKEFVLARLCGCTGMDVVSILNKMKVKFTEFKLEAEADTSKEEPILFTEIRLKYIFSGTTEREKLEKAVNLSQDKYCSVSAMLRKNCPVKWEILINK